MGREERGSILNTCRELSVFVRACVRVRVCVCVCVCARVMMMMMLMMMMMVLMMVLMMMMLMMIERVLYRVLHELHHIREVIRVLQLLWIEGLELRVEDPQLVDGSLGGIQLLRSIDELHVALAGPHAPPDLTSVLFEVAIDHAMVNRFRGARAFRQLILGSDVDGHLVGVAQALVLTALEHSRRPQRGTRRWTRGKPWREPSPPPETRRNSRDPSKQLCRTPKVKV